MSITICILTIQLFTQSPHAYAAPPLPSMNLIIVGADGNQTILNETNIAGLPSYRAFGGYKNQLGILRGLGYYTGTPISTLCNLVGGITSNCKLRITANDSYTKELTFAEVNGEYMTYNNLTGAQAPHNEPLVPIVAYYYNDTDLAPSDGPLRLAVVGPEGLVTDSTYWVKLVVRIEIIDTSIPEFPQATVVFLTLFVAVLTVSAPTVYARKRQKNITSSEPA
jgi:hypothetical protein